jgi:hypothetical protein
MVEHDRKEVVRLTIEDVKADPWSFRADLPLIAKLPIPGWLTFLIKILIALAPLILANQARVQAKRARTLNPEQTTGYLAACERAGEEEREFRGLSPRA